MKRNAKPNTIIFRLDDDNYLNLEILQKATNIDKSKIIRMILKDWFNTNEEQINKYYEETKTN